MKMKIAIVGCGMIADAHVNQIRKMKDTDIVAACDKEPLMAKQLAERYDIPHQFTDINQLLEQIKPDVVHIITPPASHLALALAAMEAGSHVIMEKPFTVTSDEANALIDKAMTLNRKIMVNHFHNFSPPSVRLRQMVAKGMLGEVIHMEGFYSYRISSPVAGAMLKDKYSWLHQLPGKLLQNNIDHLIGKFVEFIPDSQPEVWAQAKQINSDLRSLKHSYILDELRVAISGEKVSAYGTFSVNINPFQHKMIIYGTKSTASIDYESRTLLLTPSSSAPGPFGKLVDPFIVGKRYLQEGLNNIIRFIKFDFHFYSGANTLFGLFYKSIKNNTEVPLPYSSILKTSYIMEDIFNQINGDIEVRMAV